MRTAGSTKSGNAHKTQTIHELLAPDAVGHLEGGRDIIGPEPFAVFQKSMLKALPDMKVEILSTLSVNGARPARVENRAS